MLIMELFIEFFKVRIYYEHIDRFLPIFFLYGFPLVTGTYAFSHLFENNN